MRVFIYEYTSATLPSGRSGKSLQAEGWAMLSVLLEDFQRVPGIETVTLLHAGSSHCVAGSVRRTNHKDEERNFRELAHDADFSLVIAPEFDDILLTRSRWLEDAGGRSLGSSPAAVALTADKLTLSRYLIQHQVPTPECKAVQSGEKPCSLSYPLVWKPRYGAGSQATFLVNCQEDWPRCREEVIREGQAGEMLVQPFVEGMPASVAFLAGETQAVALPPAAQKLSQDGRFRYLGGKAPLPSMLAERACRLGAGALGCVPGLRGYVGVDLILGQTDGGEQDCVIEINPRLTTSYVGLRALSESNLAEAMLRIARGEKAPALRWKQGCVCFDEQGRYEYQRLGTA